MREHSPGKRTSTLMYPEQKASFPIDEFPMSTFVSLSALVSAEVPQGLSRKG
jgi:hypothetical protein